MSDAGIPIGDSGSTDVPSPNEPAETPTEEVSPDESSYDDVRAVIQAEIATALEREKINNVLIGWVNDLDPVTIRLLDGEDITPVLKSQGMVLKLQDKVGLKHTVNGWIITEQLEPVATTTALGMVPVGAMMVWPKTTALPSGWHIANGTNGTDDMRNVFIVGAGSSFAFGASGGSQTHTHSSGGLTGTDTHSHTFSGAETNNAGNHSHTAETGGSHSHGGGNTSNRGIAGGGATVMAHPLPSQAGHTHSTSTNGSHSHSVSGSLSSDGHNHSTPSIPSQNHLPPWRAYHWIQFTGV